MSAFLYSLEKPVYQNRRDFNFAESLVFAIGFMLVLVGLPGIMLGAPSYPGSQTAKILCALTGIGVAAIGAGFIAMAYWLLNRRHSKRLLNF